MLKDTKSIRFEDRTTDILRDIKRRAAVGVSALALALALASTPVTAYQTSEPVEFNVPEMSLEKALIAFSEQSRIQIIAPTEYVKGYKGRSISGSYSPTEALNLILENTPLKYEFSSDNTVYIKPAKEVSGAKKPKSTSQKRAAQAPSNSSMAETSDSGPEEGDELLLEEIVTTGTRLKNSSFTGIAPVQVISVDAAGLKGSFSATDIIRSTSLATGSFQINQQLGAVAPGGSVNNGGAGVNGLSLRGLGTQRSLIVLDGRRLSPSGVQGRIGAVDLNVLPSSALSRVEVVKDGTSSVYGADAIAGVVNGITKKNYDGGTIQAVGNMPLAGEGDQFFISGDYGKTFNKGWISLSAEYSKQNRVRNKDRDFLNCSEDYVFNPNTGERADIVTADGSYKCRNHNPTGAVFSADWFGGVFQPDPNQELVGSPGDSYTREYLPNWVRVGNYWLDDTDEERASYALRNETSEAYENADAISPLKRFGIFLNGEYEISDSVTFYGNFLYNHRESEYNSWMFLYQGMSGDNPNNTVSQGLQDASGGNSSGAIQYQVVRPYNAAQTVNYYSAVAGLKGDFGGGFLTDWTWDAFVSYGRSEGTYTQDFMYRDRLNAISLGDTACDPSYLNPAVSSADLCNGVNIPVLSTRFLVDQDWTDEEAAFLTGRETGKTTYEQLVVEGSMSGSLFSLPAGDVEMVVGGSYRRDEIDDRPGQNAIEQNYHLFSTAGRTAGSEDVKEVFGEIGIPILADKPFAQNVSAVASGRYTKYGISGNKATYKVGLNWSFNPSFAIRGSYGTSFRGPNLYELYLADQTSFQSIGDPCREYADSTDPQVAENCAALGIEDDFKPLLTDALISQGGAILEDGTSTIKPETATTYTLGFIFTPQNTGLSIAVDYFNINVRNEIDVLSAGSILNGCYGSKNFPNNVYCSLIDRNGAVTTDGSQPYAITAINRRFINIDSQKNSGLDFLVSYYKDFDAFSMSVDLQGTYQFKDKVTRSVGEDVVIDDYTGRPNEPEFTSSLDFVIRRNGWSFYYGAYALGSSGLTEYYEGDTFSFGNGYNNQQLTEKLDTDFMVYHTISIGKRLDNGISWTLGVNNLLDTDPPTVSVDWKYDGYRTGTAAQNSWDLRGRRVFFRLRKDF